MNFLQLVQDLHRESGSGGVAPASLDNLKGENLRLKNWIAQADLEIQEKHVDWKFLWAQHSMELLADTPIYTPLTSGGFSLSPNSSIGEYDRLTFRLDGNQLPAVNYIDVKSDLIDEGTGSPYRVVIMPDGSLRFDQTPDQPYTVTFDYWYTPVELSLATDEPQLPVRFHRAIVGKALMLYAKYESAEEIMQHGVDMYTTWVGKLEADQLPGDRFMQRKAEGNIMDMVVE